MLRSLQPSQVRTLLQVLIDANRLRNCKCTLLSCLGRDTALGQIGSCTTGALWWNAHVGRAAHNNIGCRRIDDHIRF